MLPPRLTALLWLLAAPLVSASQPPLEAALEQVLAAPLVAPQPPLEAALEQVLDASLVAPQPPLEAALEQVLDASLVASQPPLEAALEQVLDAFLDVVAPVSAVLGDSPCRRQGLAYRDAIKQGQSWALHMLDAGAKLPSGLLSRNLVQLGDFDQCLGVRLAHPALGVLEGRHCLVTLGAGAGDAQSGLSVTDKMAAGGVNVTRGARIDALLERGHFLAALPLLSATWAVCVPAACSAAELQLHLRSALPALALRVAAHACSTRADAQPQWDWQAAVAGLVLTSSFLLMIFATVHDLVTKDASKRRPYLIAFSLYTNTRRLFVSNASTPDSLSSLHGIRCLATVGVVAFHFYMMAAVAPLTNASQAASRVVHWTHVLIYNGTLNVDAFLVLSGTLLAFRQLRERQRGTPFSVWRLYVGRYFRLAPSHAVYMLALAASIPLVRSLVDAPLVKANLEAAPSQDACRGPRWLGLLYVANYFHVECQCVTWYLGVDMQLVWLSPLLLYPLWRSLRLGMALLGLLAVAGTGLVFTIAYQHRLQVLTPMVEPRDSGNIQHVYFATHARFVPWLFGLGVGALLARRVAPSRRQAALGWCACVGLFAYVFAQAHASNQRVFGKHRQHSDAFGPHRQHSDAFGPDRQHSDAFGPDRVHTDAFVTDRQHSDAFVTDRPHSDDFVSGRVHSDAFGSDRLHSAVFFALMRPAWGLATAWIVFACETGHGGLVHSFLGWRRWQLPSRLCYAVYLVHIGVVGGMTMPRKATQHYSEAAMMVSFLGVLVTSLFLATLMHLAVEVPFLNLYRLLQTRGSVSKPTKKDS